MRGSCRTCQSDRRRRLVKSCLFLSLNPSQPRPAPRRARPRAGAATAAHRPRARPQPRRAAGSEDCVSAGDSVIKTADEFIRVTFKSRLDRRDYRTPATSTHTTSAARTIRRGAIPRVADRRRNRPASASTERRAGAPRWPGARAGALRARRPDRCRPRVDAACSVARPATTWARRVTADPPANSLRRAERVAEMTHARARTPDRGDQRRADEPAGEAIAAGAAPRSSTALAPTRPPSSGIRPTCEQPQSEERDEATSAASATSCRQPNGHVTPMPRVTVATDWPRRSLVGAADHDEGQRGGR